MSLKLIAKCYVIFNYSLFRFEYEQIDDSLSSIFVIVVIGDLVILFQIM